MKYAEAPGTASSAAETIPAVEDSAMPMVSPRAFSFAAIRSAWGNKSCSMARLLGVERVRCETFPASPVPRQAFVHEPVAEAPMTNALLTLHDPAAARRYYADGLWREDNFYTLLQKHA